MKNLLLLLPMVFLISTADAKVRELKDIQKSNIKARQSRVLSRVKDKLAKANDPKQLQKKMLFQKELAFFEHLPIISGIYTRSDCMISGMSVCNQYDTDCLDDVTYICEQYPDL